MPDEPTAAEAREALEESVQAVAPAPPQEWWDESLRPALDAYAAAARREALSLDGTEFEGATPGPWRVTGGSWTDDGDVQYVLEGVKQCDANTARLIAAAPALAARVRELEAEVARRFDHTEQVVDRAGARVRAQAQEIEKLRAALRDIVQLAAFVPQMQRAAQYEAARAALGEGE